MFKIFSDVPAVQPDRLLPILKKEENLTISAAIGLMGHIQLGAYVVTPLPTLTETNKQMN